MKFRGLKEVGILIDEIKELKGNEVIATRRIKELKKELKDYKERNNTLEEEIEKVIQANIKIDAMFTQEHKENQKLKKELLDLRKSFKEACRSCDRVKERT